jgi:formate dehydrogenase subunit gamma
MTHPQLSVAASEELVRRHAVQGATLMAILHAVQDEIGYVPESAIAPLASSPITITSVPRRPRA